MEEETVGRSGGRGAFAAFCIVAGFGRAGRSCHDRDGLVVALREGLLRFEDAGATAEALS